MITYRSQFDKMTAAYISGNVNPYTACSCFVGNLLNGTRDWIEVRGSYIGKLKSDLDSLPAKKAIEVIQREGEGFYTTEEIIELEAIFLNTYGDAEGDSSAFMKFGDPTPEDEEALFLAFQKTLDRLKEIRISKGEEVEEAVFIKRSKAIV